MSKHNLGDEGYTPMPPSAFCRLLNDFSEVTEVKGWWRKVLYIINLLMIFLSVVSLIFFLIFGWFILDTAWNIVVCGSSFLLWIITLFIQRVYSKHVYSGFGS